VAIAAGGTDGIGQELPAGHYALVFASRPSSVRVSPDGREFVVEFPAALADGEADRAARALGPLLEGYAEGYGAVRFRLSVPAQAAIASIGGRQAVEVAAQEQVQASADDERRLHLLEARVLARDGDVAGARVRLTQIADERPGDLEPLIALAETESAAGSWQHALGLYDGVRRLFPEATDIARDERALATRHAPFVRTDASATFGPGGERAQTVTITGDLPLAEDWRASASLQTAHDEIRQLRRSGSGVAADYSGTKLLTSLDLAHDWSQPGITTRLGVFASPRTFGASVKQEFTSRLGTTTLGAFYHQPYWGTVMAFAADARRDQVDFAQTVPLPDQWQVQVGVGLIRYGTPSRDSVASGPSALAGVSRALPERWLPLDGMQVRLGYRLEAEYLSRAAAGPTSAGPLPLLDMRAREIHSVYAETTASLGAGTATALFGYAIDRFGGGGPQAMLRYTGGEDSDRLAFSVEAGVEPSLDLRPRTLFHIGGFAIWRFGGARET